MWIIILLGLVSGLAARPAAAQGVPAGNGPSGGVPAGGVQVRPDGTVVISDAECRSLVPHVAAPDVAYQPGIDVNGKPVTPADLPASSSPFLSTVPPVAISRERIGKARVGRDAVLFKREVQIGTITLDGNRALFNGVPLTPPEQDLLIGACRDRRPPGR